VGFAQDFMSLKHLEKKEGRERHLSHHHTIIWYLPLHWFSGL